MEDPPIDPQEFLAKLESIYGDPKRPPTGKKQHSTAPPRAPPKVDISELHPPKSPQSERIRSELQREIMAEAYEEPPKAYKKPERQPKDNMWQDYLSVCLKKVNPDNPQSLSHIEVVTGKQMYPNEQMRACGVEWKQDRLLENPVGEGFVPKFETEFDKFKKGLKQIERE